MNISAIVLCAVFADPSFYMSKQRQKDICIYMPTVIEAAELNNLDPFLLAGLITIESRWHRNAVSSAGACGLTQIMPKYSKYTCEQLKNWKVSINAGAKILSRWIAQYGDDDIPTGLCGYYSGYRCKPKIPKFGERYYKKVLAQKQKIQDRYAIIKDTAK